MADITVTVPSTCPVLRHIRCTNQSIYQAVWEQFGPNCYPVVTGMGVPHPTAPGMVGTVTVRSGETFAVIKREDR